MLRIFLFRSEEQYILHSSNIKEFKSIIKICFIVSKDCGNGLLFRYWFVKLYFSKWKIFSLVKCKMFLILYQILLWDESFQLHKTTPQRIRSSFILSFQKRLWRFHISFALNLFIWLYQVPRGPKLITN